MTRTDTDHPTPSTSAARGAGATLLCWQGLRLTLPRGWNPTRIDGDFAKGSILLGDLNRPRMAVRWSSLNKSTDPQKWSSRVMREEIGALACDEAVTHARDQAWTQSLLYIEPKPPGRDVWVGVHTTSNRGFEVVYQAKRRDRILVDNILPGLTDEATDAKVRAGASWSIFDLSLTLPRPIPMTQQMLNAGDLALTFSDKKTSFTVRQVAVAKLALQRFTLEQWLGRTQWTMRKKYRPVDPTTPVELVGFDGRVMKGFSRKMVRRRRYAWLWWEHVSYVTTALHDETRDRLVIVQSTDAAMIPEIVATVGWAEKE